MSATHWRQVAAAAARGGVVGGLLAVCLDCAVAAAVARQVLAVGDTLLDGEAYLLASLGLAAAAAAAAAVPRRARSLATAAVVLAGCFAAAAVAGLAQADGTAVLLALLATAGAGGLLLPLLARQPAAVLVCQPAAVLAASCAALVVFWQAPVALWLPGYTAWPAAAANDAATVLALLLPGWLLLLVAALLPWRRGLAPQRLLLRSDLAQGGLADRGLAQSGGRRGVLLAALLPLLLAALRWSQFGAAVVPAPAAVVTADWRLLAATAGHQVYYDRRRQELALFHGSNWVVGEGPDRPQAEFLAVLLHALLQPGDRVLLLGAGSGRLPQRLHAVAADLQLEIADFRPAARPLLSLLQADGPVPTGLRPELPAQRLQSLPGPLAVLDQLLPASRQAIVLGEPLHAAAGWQPQLAVQQQLRRALGPGLLLQPLQLDRTPPELLQQLLQAASQVHPCNLVLAVGPVACLLSCAAPPQWPAPAAVAAWPSAARWLAHAARFDAATDLPRLLLGSLRSAPRSPAAVASAATAAVSPLGLDETAAAERLQRNRKLLQQWLELPPVVPPGEDSTLLHWQFRQAELQAAERALALLPAASAESLDSAQALAARFLPIGAPAALLQAALGLQTADGTRLRNAELASRCAHAIDPTLFTRPLPPVARDLPLPVAQTGALEDLARLPAAARLLVIGVGDVPRAVALRARFPSAVARALVDELARGPLPPLAMQALRELADPFVLAAAAAALAARDELPTLLSLWRGDLPLPAPLRELWQRDPAAREPLLAAVAGRRDSGSRELLAAGLLAEDARLRRAAAVALRDSVGSAIPYDPDWPPSQRKEAAERLRNLHNRTP